MSPREQQKSIFSAMQRSRRFWERVEKRERPPADMHIGKNLIGMLIIQGVSEKTEQIWNRSQRREAAQSMKFFINIDCLGIYDVE